MFQKFVWTIFLQGLLNTATKTEGGLITDFNRFRGHSNLRSNVDGKNKVEVLQRIRQSKNLVKHHDPWQPVKQLKPSHTLRSKLDKFTTTTTTTTKTPTTTTTTTTKTTVKTTKKLRDWKTNWFGTKENQSKSLVQLYGQDDLRIELLAPTEKKSGVKGVNDRANNKGTPTTISQHCSSTTCGTRKSVEAVTQVSDQVVGPNLITLFTSFTPRTRTQPRYTSIGTMCQVTKMWKCNQLVEDEPATDWSNKIKTVWEEFTLPTRQPKYLKPIDPVTKWFLQMTSTSKWRTRPIDICTKASG